MLTAEEVSLASTLESLRSQRVRLVQSFAAENARARGLTAQIHDTRRVEDKALLASDEAVSHALAHKRDGDLKTIDRLIAQPYFARFVITDRSNPREQELEYKLGLAANPDCRIMDWRRAPVSKLYYEYKEGEEFDEEIQGRDRSGVIKLRHSVDIEGSALRKVSCRYGTFINKDGRWEKRSSRAVPSHQKGGLPQILTLITPEQFKIISDDPHKPLFIQGLAGSGKTTVALHRLAWLLNQEDYPMTSDECAIIVLSETLKHYVQSTLPSMHVEGVKVFTFAEFCAQCVKTSSALFSHSQSGIKLAASAAPAGSERVKNSVAMLRRIEDATNAGPYTEIILNILRNPAELLAIDETKVLDRESIKLALQRSEEIYAQSAVDRSDLALILRLFELRNAGVTRADGSIGKLKHLVVDELQEYSSTQLAALAGAVDNIGHLTLVGDTDQKLDRAMNFPGWEKLRLYWKQQGVGANFFSLQVSFRNTLPIMRLAQKIKSIPLSSKGREGRLPIWFKSHSPDMSLECAQKWLTTALERYPDALSAAICRNAADARELFNWLKPTFPAAMRLGIDSEYSFEEGLVITHLEESRGLEFSNVLLWEVSRNNYPDDPESRSGLYVAITRASENLSIFTSGQPSPLLPALNSGLMRIYGAEQS
ncbi:MAG: AAA family ATPase [Oligoflexia bacterium]|nr:AAA family ATPase [Oligoflexia bacterium]